MFPKLNHAPTDKTLWTMVHSLIVVRNLISAISSQLGAKWFGSYSQARVVIGNVEEIIVVVPK